MKKYITIAALLTAGTAFANAASVQWTIDEPTYYGDSGDQWVAAILLSGDLGLDDVSTNYKNTLDFTYNTGNSTVTVTTPTSGVLGTSLTQVLAGNVGNALTGTFSNVDLAGVDVVTLVWAAPYQYHDQSKGGAMNYSVIDVPSDIGDVWTLSFESINLRNDSVPGKVSPIPEPSAFGMLAGLGALALVASRRRRR